MTGRFRVGLFRVRWCGGGLHGGLFDRFVSDRFLLRRGTVRFLPGGQRQNRQGRGPGQGLPARCCGAFRPLTTGILPIIHVRSHPRVPLY